LHITWKIIPPQNDLNNLNPIPSGSSLIESESMISKFEAPSSRPAEPEFRSGASLFDSFLGGLELKETHPPNLSSPVVLPSMIESLMPSNINSPILTVSDPGEFPVASEINFKATAASPNLSEKVEIVFPSSALVLNPITLPHTTGNGRPQTRGTRRRASSMSGSSPGICKQDPPETEKLEIPGICEKDLPKFTFESFDDQVPCKVCCLILFHLISCAESTTDSHTRKFSFWTPLPVSIRQTAQ
jgi:hypothetical protein